MSAPPILGCLGSPATIRCRRLPEAKVGLKRDDQLGLISISVKLFTPVRHERSRANSSTTATWPESATRRCPRATVRSFRPSVKGAEVTRLRYELVDPSELAPFVQLATKRTDVDTFVDLVDIHPALFRVDLRRGGRRRTRRADGHHRQRNVTGGFRPVGTDRRCAD